MAVTSRKKKALATRRRMIQAAYRLFCERGYSVPLTEIAGEAGVAVQTLYFTFHTKGALLTEAMGLAVTGDVLSVPPHHQRWFDKVKTETDPRKAVQHMVDGTMVIFERTGPLVGIFQSGDPELREQWQYHQKLRLDGYREIMEMIAKKGGMRRGLSIEEATDIVFALFSPDLFQVMVNERGWTVDRWRKWIGATLADALFGSNQPRG
jgi:AcrR family transcriptional regulator